MNTIRQSELLLTEHSLDHLLLRFPTRRELIIKLYENAEDEAIYDLIFIAVMLEGTA